MNQIKSKISAIIIFSIAMAALEGAVVVYLRALYYPNGFTVALKLIDEHILLVEVVREIATLIMLVCIACLVGKRWHDRFAYFLLSFAIWDIFYYVWLKIFIDWPSSFFEWDILFLIPITWLGPVLAPIISSLTMIVFAIVILKKSNPLKFSFLVTSCLLIGSVLILFTFMQDYGNLLLNTDSVFDYPNLLKNERFVKAASIYLPKSYNWFLFILGELLICICVVWLYANSHRHKSHKSIDE